MAKWLAIMVVVAAGILVAGGRSVHAADEVYLNNGGRLVGDVEDTDVTLHTAQGDFKVNRDVAWQVSLGTGATGDVVYLRNGSRLSGLVDRPGYTLKLAGGEARALDRSEIAIVKLAAPGGTPRQSRLTDVMILRNGDEVAGEVMPAEFELALPSGPQRFQRDSVWRIWLDSAAGDGMQLANGSLVRGIVTQPAYEVRTPDGQTLAFSRDQVKDIYLRGPEKPQAALAPPAGPVTPPPGPTAPTTMPAAALPPAVRAVLRDLQFEFDRWELTADARKTLEDVSGALKAYPSLKLLIEGHADERGTPEYNLALGERRAQAARDYLVGLGIETARLDIISYGEERPLDPAHNEVAWAINRRAHFAVKR
jgi:peptidoglycan-associated lipoprotein